MTVKSGAKDKATPPRRKKETLRCAELIEAVQALYPFMHESGMRGESAFELAWLRVEKALKAVEGGTDVAQPEPLRRKKSGKNRRIKVGEWVCTFGKVTGLHGRRHLIVQIGPHECTLLRSEVWNPDDDVREGRNER